jgi:hypothetical protein
VRLTAVTHYPTGIANGADPNQQVLLDRNDCTSSLRSILNCDGSQPYRLWAINDRAGDRQPWAEKRSCLHPLPPLMVHFHAPHLADAGNAIRNEERQITFVIPVDVHIPQPRNEIFVPPINDLGCLRHSAWPIRLDTGDLVTTPIGATAAATATTGFSLVAENGRPLPGVQRVQNEVFMAAGKTYDVMINGPAAGSTAPALAVYDPSRST